MRGGTAADPPPPFPGRDDARPHKGESMGQTLGEASGGRFRAIVEKTIRLATARREEGERLYPRTKEVQTGGDAIRRFSDELTGKTPRPAEHALMEYADSLDTADLAALVTLHYVGRNAYMFPTPEATLAWQRNEIGKATVRDTALMKISERTLLGEYLKKGLEVAAAIGLDIEKLPQARP
jgi:hypothetical protein